MFAECWWRGGPHLIRMHSTLLAWLYYYCVFIVVLSSIDMFLNSGSELILFMNPRCRSVHFKVQCCNCRIARNSFFLCTFLVPANQFYIFSCQSFSSALMGSGFLENIRSLYVHVLLQCKIVSSAKIDTTLYFKLVRSEFKH